MGTSDALLTFFIALIVSAVIFIIIRSIILWYWKIDVIVENQVRQIELLNTQVSLLESLARQRGVYYVPNQTTDSPEEIERKAKRYDQSK